MIECQQSHPLSLPPDLPHQGGGEIRDLSGWTLVTVGATLMNSENSYLECNSKRSCSRVPAVVGREDTMAQKLKKPKSPSLNLELNLNGDECRLHVCQQLRFMDIFDLFHAFQFQDPAYDELQWHTQSLCSTIHQIPSSSPSCPSWLSIMSINPGTPGGFHAKPFQSRGRKGSGWHGGEMVVRAGGVSR